MKPAATIAGMSVYAAYYCPFCGMKIVDWHICASKQADRWNLYRSIYRP